MTDRVLQYIEETYSVTPEYLWKHDRNAALRNHRTKKWFAALIRDLPKCKLGLASEEQVDVLNLKCDPLMTHSVADGVRCFPGYHMNKEHWISVLLDGSMPLADIAFLIDISFLLVDRYAKSKKKPSHE